MLDALRSRIAQYRWLHKLYFDLLVPLARRVPISSRILGPVKEIHPSVSAYLSTDSSRGSLHGLEAARQVDYGEPGICVPERPINFTRHDRQTLPEQFVARIRSARVACRSLDVVSPEDGYFAEFWCGDRANIHARSLKVLRLPRVRRRRGSFLSIATHRAGNYYHWLNDCLTRLRALELTEGSISYRGRRLVVPQRSSRFHLQSLALLGFDADDLELFGEEHWQVEELVIPSLASSPQHSSPEACRWLRRRLVPAALRRADPGPRRIYISRQAATKRRLLNEEAVMNHLEGAGFVSVRMEEAPVEQQIAWAHGAEVVVAPHGAGLANIMFMQEGTRVVELLPARRAKPCFYSLAAAMGLHYGCATDALAGDPDSAKWAPDVDFSVPVERVARAVHWACSTGGC